MQPASWSAALGYSREQPCLYDKHDAAVSDIDIGDQELQFVQIMDDESSADLDDA